MERVRKGGKGWREERERGESEGWRERKKKERRQSSGE